MPEGARLEALSIRSDPARIRDARTWIAAVARSAGFTEEETHDLAVALSEVCSNSHRHSYRGRTDGRIDLEAEVDDGHVSVTVRDYGVAFDPSAYQAPQLSEPAEGGYGLYLIRSLMDDVKYIDMGVGTRVVLIKHRRPQETVNAMTHPQRSSSAADEALRSLEVELKELGRVHDVALDMIERSHDLDGLLDRILDEYEVRLRELPCEALKEDRGTLSPAAAGKLRALVTFAAEAAALKQKAAVAGELRARAGALAEANASLGRALADAEAARRELDGVLAALDAGILILGADGSVRHANPAGRRLALGHSADADRPSTKFLDGVPRGADAEVRVAGESGDGRLLMVARRNLDGGEGGEVVLLSDITRRSLEIEERHRIEKLSEVLRTLSVLSHKINNPLTSLLGRAQMLKLAAGTDPKVLKAAAVIEESAVRIAELIRELANVVKEGRQEAVEKVLSIDTGPGSGGGA